MKCKYFLFTFFSFPFSLSPSSLISLSYFTLSFILLSSVFLKKQHAFNLFLIYSSTITIYEENMLTHQPSLLFSQLTTQQVFLPISLLAVSNSLLVNCKNCILNFTYTFNSWFWLIYYEIYFHSFILSFFMQSSIITYTKQHTFTSLTIKIKIRSNIFMYLLLHTKQIKNSII